MEKVRNEVLHSQHSDQLKEITKDLSDVLQVSVLYALLKQHVDRYKYLAIQERVSNAFDGQSIRYSYQPKGKHHNSQY